MEKEAPERRHPGATPSINSNPSKCVGAAGDERRSRRFFCPHVLPEEPSGAGSQGQRWCVFYFEVNALPALKMTEAFQAATS